MKKKIIITISIIILLIGIVIINKNVHKNSYVENTILENKKPEKMLTMMLEQTEDAGDYQSVTQSGWPTEGYKFNSKLSRCENGGELYWDSEKNIVFFSNNSIDKCYIYFDKVTLITFTLEDTEYQAKLNMTYGEWMESEYNTFGYWFSSLSSGGTTYDITLDDKINENSNVYLRKNGVDGPKKEITPSRGTLTTTDGEVIEINDSDDIKKYIKCYLLNENNLKTANLFDNFNRTRILHAFKDFDYGVGVLATIIITTTDIINADVAITVPGVLSSSSISVTFVGQTTDKKIDAEAIQDDGIKLYTTEPGIYVINKLS